MWSEPQGSTKNADLRPDGQIKKSVFQKKKKKEETSMLS